MPQQSNYLRPVIQYALEHGHQSDIHGFSHWCRVARNADLLMDEGVNRHVVELFAFFHDIRRESDGHDPEHGSRGAECTIELRETLLRHLSDQEFDQLVTACRLHTSTSRTDDPTVNACFDADRLDLWRVSMTPDPKQMASPRGRFWATRFEQMRRVFMHTPLLYDTTPLNIRMAMVQQGKTLSTAESCTSGRIAALLTSVSGASEYFQGSIVAYQDHIKVEQLGVRQEDINRYDVVSSQVAEQMVRGACRLFHTDYAIASTGYAESTPTRLAHIYIAWGSAEDVHSLCLSEDMGRESNTQHAACQAIIQFLQYINQ